MKKIIFLLLFFCGLTTINAQDERIAKTDIPLSDVERITMPRVNNKALLEAELAARVPGRAPKYAETMQVYINPETQGTWEYLDNGNAVWRLRIFSANAKSLNLGFTKYVMPANGSLVLYSTDYEHIMGPFTPADNEEHEQLWTPILEGEELVIEVSVPQQSVDALQLELTNVNHDYIGFSKMASTIMSGSCNLDVICGEADGWGIVDGYRDIIQSVAVIGTGGGTFCTGFLVNNVRQDCRPLFMTANHCGITSGNAASLVAYWNFQNSTCREPGSPASGAAGDGTLNDFNTGATHLASYAPSDVTILELDDPVSETANAFFAGWDASETIPQSAIGVHHPSTDEKRISFENDPLYEGIGLSDNASDDGDHLVVPDWDIGTTEPGSSGSPLFNADKRVVGQLHGGGAACGNDDYDTYGWFFTSWEGGGTPETRLKDWLDPDNTGTLIIDGRIQMQCNFFVDATPAVQNICAPADLEYNLNVSENFLADVTMTLVDLPEGLSATFSQNPVAPGGSASLQITGTAALAAGEYTIVLAGTDGTEVSNSNLVINVATAAPTTAVLSTPTNAATEVSPSPAFSWTADLAETFEMQLATDNGFANIVANPNNLNAPEFAAQSLDANTTYYWRVRSTNICGTSEWSEIFSFTTANCTQDFTADTPIEISSGPANTISSEINIPFVGVINDLDVINVSGTHSYLGDLTFTLTSPTGTEVILIASACGSESDFNVTFDNEAGSTPPCPYNDGGTYTPEGDLSAFYGENPQGTWTLSIADNANFDGGSLENWGLQICASGVVNISATAEPAVLDLCTSETGSYTVEVAGDFEGDITVSASSNPAGVNFNIPNPTTQAGGSVLIEISNLITTAEGSYSLNFAATDGNNTANAFATLNVASAPAVADLLMPANSSTNVSILNPSFSWENIANADNYLIEIATDEDFNNILTSETVDINDYQYSGEINYSTVYYWRVTANNDCGTSISVTNNFTTEDSNSTNDLEGISVQIAPNPTNSLINITLGGTFAEKVDAEVYGVNGQLLQTQHLAAGALGVTINMSDYADGVYLVKLKSNNDVLVRRVVVQK